jgi:hypothetical protein
MYRSKKKAWKSVDTDGLLLTYSSTLSLMGISTSHSTSNR